MNPIIQTICINCHYWCWDFLLANKGCDDPYDYSRSFCGLHGRREIENPYSPIDFDMLNGGVNDQYPNCKCGFFPNKNNKPIQLALFEFQ